mgnify:CR=1 FL=1
MRDFNSRDIHGDVNINDNSNNSEYKLLINCSNEELVREEAHRQNLLSDERSRRLGITWKFLGLSALLLLAAAGWFYIKGAVDTASLIIGGAGVLVGIATLQRADKPAAFEQRQLATISEIRTLLRERGFRR